MKKLIILSTLLLLANSSYATKLQKITIDELFAKSDHVLTGYITSLELVDAQNNKLRSDDSPTGIGSGNKIRMTIEIDDIIKTTSKNIPTTLTIVYRSSIHRSMKARRESIEYKQIFFLSGDDFIPAARDQFYKPITTIKGKKPDKAL